jgi:hypothetical protein
MAQSDAFPDVSDLDHNPAEAGWLNAQCDFRRVMSPRHAVGLRRLGAKLYYTSVARRHFRSPTTSLSLADPVFWQYSSVLRDSPGIRAALSRWIAEQPVPLLDIIDRWSPPGI